MDTAIDVNNEKIQMRKEIKRAKVWVISKLVRQIRNLQNKKGSELQIEKNKRRAKRFESEVDFLKGIKPDDIFKRLLSSSKVASEKDISLEDRALCRIGSVAFIQSRMSTIKANVAAFHKVRSDRNPEAFNLNIEDEKLENTEDEGPLLKLTSSTHKSNQTDSESDQLGDRQQIKSEISSDLPKSITCSDGDCNDTSDLDTDTVLQTTRNTVMHKNSDNKDLKTSSISENDSASENDSDSGVCDPDIAAETKVEEVIVESHDGYSVVIPSSKIPVDCSNRTKLNEIADGVEDVTEVLTNIGADFDSEKSDSDYAIDLEDLGKQSEKDKNMAITCDPFFLDNTGKIKKTAEKSIPSETQAGDDDGLLQIKSCFVESLTSVSHQRNKGKNRPSQRARRRLASKKSENFSRADSKFHNSNVSSSNVERGVSTAATDVEIKPIHPSWEASKKRKLEQNSLREFQGKRVCFDDSD